MGANGSVFLCQVRFEFLVMLAVNSTSAFGICFGECAEIVRVGLVARVTTKVSI